MKRLWHTLTTPYSGPARYNVLGHELSIELSLRMIRDNVPYPRVCHERGWYLAFVFGARSSDPIIEIEYDYGDPPE